ncbi:Cupin domain-containing protein [Sulfidibacter corallicola]|uniref:Cupin domain-containing protein n=1 Tax=Sulfidibacter corallicola TaxID=2818388 RepID=A0A8A4TQ44_SULCO|nr:cupin domain-containing protein [Sulfidibacter corallicola]QTD51547.1 cupin domain-containing protein [Sulfidibacter corallicola]
MNVLNLLKSFDDLSEYWSPRVIGRVNQSFIKIAKAKGEMVWHDHSEEDEFFLVLKGELRIDLEDRAVILGPMDTFTVPHGVKHRPVAKEETWLVLIELASTKHTGDVASDLTRSVDDQLEWLNA